MFIFCSVVLVVIFNRRKPTNIVHVERKHPFHIPTPKLAARCETLLPHETTSIIWSVWRVWWLPLNYFISKNATVGMYA